MILDKSNRTEKYSGAYFIQRAGIPTFIDAKHAIAHNKTMVIDSHTVLTGSFNFTKAAENNNAEKLLVIEDVDLAKKYTATTTSGCSAIAPSGREYATLSFNNASCLQSAYSLDGKLLAGGSENGTVYFVDTEKLRNSLSPFMPK